MRRISTIWSRTLISIFVILASAGLAAATTVIIPSDDQLIIESRAIVRARVLSISSSYDAGSDRVFTYVKLAVNAVFKGDVRASEIVIKQFGGQTADHMTMLYGAPRFAVGEKVFLFLDTSSDGTLRVHDEFLGKYLLERDPATGKLMVSRSAPDSGVHVLPQDSKVDATWQMEYSSYVEKLRGKISANMAKSFEYEDKYFHGVPVLSEPREYRNKLKSGGIQPEFHVWPGTPVRWFGPDTGQPVTYLINVDQAPTGAQGDVDAAMQAWSNVSGCAMRVVDGGTTTNCTAAGVGVASFDNCEGFFSGGGTCQSVLAEGGWSANGNTKVVNGVTFNQITSGFLSFNPFAVCSFSSPCNVQEIATHEMGHSLGMGHSWDPSYPGTPTATEQAATMYYIAHFDGRCASIKTDDINGITFIYPGTSSAPNYIGFVDHASCDTIVGWAADRNRLNTSINVELFDGTTLITTILANGLRSDVGGALGDNGLHGFNIPTPSPLNDGNLHTLHVRFETSTTELIGSPTSINCGAPNYVGFVDHAACDNIYGWAADRNRPSAPINVEIYDGSTLVGIVTANIYRPGVDTYLGDDGKHGFVITTPAALQTGGPHSIHIKFETSATELSGSPASINCTSAATNYIGFLDHAGCDTIYGWAADTNRLNNWIIVDIYDGSTLIATLPAAIYRPGVDTFLGDNGKHGFSMVTPASLKTNTPHSLHVRFETGGTELTGSPASLTCP